jgi:dihydroflavonol-4-reductase
MTALDFAAWGLDVRVVCPAVVFGPGDIGPTPSGKLVINIVTGKAPAYTTGGFTYVDVRDAARVHVLAAEKGKPGNIYVASGHNLDNEEFVNAILRVYDGDLPKPRKLPAVVAQAAVMGMAFAAVRQGKEPDMTREYLAYSLKPGYFSNAKATIELGATFRPIEETIRDAIAYFRQRGLIKA